MSDNERQTLDLDSAVKMLPDSETIHTFVNVGPMLIGADWSRERVIETFEMHSPELSGEQATAMGHGIVVWDGERHVFFETEKKA